MSKCRANVNVQALFKFTSAIRFCAFVCLAAPIINHTNSYITTELAAMAE
jgi:hypothetical protein